MVVCLKVSRWMTLTLHFLLIINEVVFRYKAWLLRSPTMCRESWKYKFFKTLPKILFSFKCIVE